MSKGLTTRRSPVDGRRRSLTLELGEAMRHRAGRFPANEAASALLPALERRLQFAVGAVFWLLGRQVALAAAYPEGGALGGLRVSGLADVPFLDTFREATDPVAVDVDESPEWRAAPLLAGAASVLVVPVGYLGSWGALVVLGWGEPGAAAAADAAPAVEGATWLGHWLGKAAAEARRAARDVMQSPVHALPADGVESPWTLQREASALLHRAMRATGRRRGLLLSLEGGEPTPLAASRMDWSRLRRSPALAALLHQAANVPGAQLPAYFPPDDPAGEGLLVAPLAHVGQPAHGLLLLGGSRRSAFTLQDYLAAEEVCHAAAYHVRALQQAWYTNSERLAHKNLEALTLELGNKLSFEEMFQVVARWLPRIVPAAWVGMCRFPSATESGAELPAAHEAWITKAGGAQPPLIPLVRPLLATIDPRLPLTYLPDGAPVGGVRHPLVVMPVHLGNETIAALVVAAPAAASFAERQLATLREVSSSIALAFRYAQLFELVERAKRDWEHSFDAITDTLAVITPGRVVRRVNKTFALERGKRPGDFVGMACHEALYGLAQPCPGCPLEQAVALKTTADVEVRSQINEGLYQASLFPVQNEAGEVVDVVEFAKDVTFSRELQEKLLQTERLRALGEMASGAAHDFNNTLAGVMGQVELLLQTNQDPRLERGLRLIAQAASDGAATVRRIQNFARTSRGEEVRPTDLNQIVLDAIEVCAPRWKDQSERDGIPIQVRHDLRAASLVAGVASELREVLVNVLLNAVEAMPTGGVITVRTGENSRWVWVAVADQGVGMSDEVRRHIFDPFYTTKGTANSGLGMSVVYGIIKLHRGDISVSSEEGRGATVTIRLPKATKAEVPAPPEAAAPSPVPGQRVLVVDDDPRLADLLRQMLEMDGHRVTVCHGGAQALERLAAEGYDAVLTDLGMPGVSGWDVIAAARERQPAIRTGLVTGWGVQLDEIELAGKGVDVVIAKPYTLAGLRGAMARLAELRRADTAGAHV